MTIPDSMFVDPTHAWNAAIASDAHPITGLVFHAILITPPAPDVVDTEYVTIVREDLNGQRREIKRYYARDSRAWLNRNGGSGQSDEGKYGAVGIAVSGDDLFVTITMRVNGNQRTFPIRERGLAK